MLLLDFDHIGCNSTHFSTETDLKVLSHCTVLDNFYHSIKTLCNTDVCAEDGIHKTIYQKPPLDVSRCAKLVVTVLQDGKSCLNYYSVTEPLV